ncbi:AI-2E family transporter [Allofournierella massiliensis]|uniref:Putative PurR-regulated permease PerM n=1 Tax=Allofournierella massiliensis TaxID=1650663 RepID=A0A4R1QRA9_9FIRM|nr:AI-2E family transporter [Fournierella massiliensis]TCL56396.1 putative PurR-regulated permease PerM [Fournierella massiliensis]
MENKKFLRNVLGIATFCILLYWGLQNMDQVAGFLSTVGGLLLPFLLGAAMAFILNVPMRAIETHLPQKLQRAHRGISLVLTLAAVVGVVMVVSLLVLPQLKNTVQTIAARMPAFWAQAQQWANELMIRYPELADWLSEAGNLNLRNVTQQVMDWLKNGGLALVGNTVTAATGIISGFVNFFIALIFAIYLLFQKETLSRQGRMLLFAWMRPEHAEKVLEVVRLANKTFSNFLSGQCLEACILGALFAVGMLLFRMPYVLLVSVLVAVTALIPVFGAFIGCFVGAFLILIQNPMQAVVFVILFLVIQQIEGNLIYPRVVGGSVGLPSVWVLAAVTLGGSMFGVVGMLVMIPLCSVLYSMLRTATRERLRSRGVEKAKYMLDPAQPGKKAAAQPAKSAKTGKK